MTTHFKAGIAMIVAGPLIVVAGTKGMGPCASLGGVICLLGGFVLFGAGAVTLVVATVTALVRRSRKNSPPLDTPTTTSTPSVS